MTEAAVEEAEEVNAVAEYKRIFKEVLDARPSGMRIRLAHAMGKNCSFVSQISNPAYPVPIPIQHLNTIFDLCHFPPHARSAFLQAYARAHPRRVGRLAEIARADDNAAFAGPWRRQAQRAGRCTDPGVCTPIGCHSARREITAVASRRWEESVKKFINTVDTMLAQSLDGFAAAHADIIALGPERKFVRRRSPNANKVALISGGGSGHEPLHAGLVGLGMLDAACPGQIFTSPTPDQIVEAATAVGGNAGVLFIVKNYAGDCMNFEMAAEVFEGPAATVVTNDDVAVEKSTYSTGRRGVAGTLVVEKIVGAAAEKGMDLKSCAELGVEVNEKTRSLGVALTSCTVPAAGTPTFTLASDEMEMGVGIHGEPGRRRVKMASADVIADEIVSAIHNDLDRPASGDVLLFVNGFGGTPTIELYLMYNAARQILEKRGLAVARSLVGSYVTSLEMAGCSITITMLDAKSTSLWDDHVHTAALRW